MRLIPLMVLLEGCSERQVQACAEAGPALLANSSTPHAALARWISLFADFLVTRHGPAEALQSDEPAFETLHAYFLESGWSVLRCLSLAMIQSGPSARQLRSRRCDGRPFAASESGPLLWHPEALMPKSGDPALVTIGRQARPFTCHVCEGVVFAGYKVKLNLAQIIHAG